MNLFKYLGTSAAAAFLENDTVRYSPPTAYNDPFELSPEFRLQDSLEGETPTVNVKFEINGGKSKIEQYEVLPENESLYSFIMNNNFVESISTSIGTTCFSGSNKSVPVNLLMWAHYAESHRGLAIQLARGSSIGKKASPVRYREKRPIIDGVILSNGSLVTLRDLYFKSTHWKYENEYRVGKKLEECVKVNCPPDAAGVDIHVSKIEPKDIERVVVGANASRELLSLALKYHNRTGVQVVKIRSSELGFGFAPSAVFGKSFSDMKLVDELFRGEGVET